MRTNEVCVQTCSKSVKCLNVVSVCSVLFFQNVVVFPHSDNKKDFMTQV